MIGVKGSEACLFDNLIVSMYDIVIVESVGLGQSEVQIDDAVDMLLLIVPPGGGDELQASKKGIMEAADMIIVNKADGKLLSVARHTKADYSAYVNLIRRKNPNWEVKILMQSSVTGDGLDDVISTILEYETTMNETGSIDKKRSAQGDRWMWSQLKHELIDQVMKSPSVSHESKEMHHLITKGQLSSRVAAKSLLDLFYKEIKEN